MQEHWLAYKFKRNPIFFSWKTFNHCQLQLFFSQRAANNLNLFLFLQKRQKNYQLPLFPENSLQFPAFSSPGKPPAISTLLLGKPIKNDQLFLFPKETFRDFQLQELISTRPRTYIMSDQSTLEGPPYLRDKVYEEAWKLYEAQKLHCAAATEYLMWAASTGNLEETEKCLQEVETRKNTGAFVAYHDERPVVVAAACGHIEIVYKILDRTGWGVSNSVIDAADDDVGRRLARVLHDRQKFEKGLRERGIEVAKWST